jgi:hypothetical protein
VQEMPREHQECRQAAQMVERYVVFAGRRFHKRGIPLGYALNSGFAR